MKNKINAIYDEDLKSFLCSKDELPHIVNGERFCKICGVPINLNNIQMVIPHANAEFEYICESINCVEKYHEKNK